MVAFATAAGTITGNLIGERRTGEVLRANQQVIKLNTIVLVGLLCFFAAFYYPILRIYTNDGLLVKKAVLPYMTALLCFIPLFSGFIGAAVKKREAK